MKKVFSTLGTVITVLITVLAVCIMVFTVISVRTVGQGGAGLFGYRAYIVLSDSMQSTFQVGDIIVSRESSADDVQVGDIITFRSIDPANYGEVVTHMVREITTYNGGTAFVTYGTTTGDRDAYPAPAENIIGEYSFRLPKLGYFFQFLKTPMGYFTVVLIPFLLLIGLQIYRFIRLWRRYRWEQMAELRAQRMELEAERRRTQAMQEELERLRAKAGAGRRHES